MIPKKYIYLNNFSYQAGLTDLKDRFTDYIKISILLNLIPILPTIYLLDCHTNKPNNLLIDYIQVPDFVCREFPENTEEVFYWNLTNRFIPNDELYQFYQPQLIRLQFFIEYQDKFKEIAAEVVSHMKRPLCVIHVRRGDYLNICPSLQETTSPRHIQQVLERHTFQDCYLKSNEDSTFFNELSVWKYDNFPVLKKIKESGDNYALYAVECCIRDVADLRISTFNTTLAEPWYLPNHDAHFFHDYLDENKGYQ
jgi:hypothetical protein